jgi:hypothetical protein
LTDGPLLERLVSRRPDRAINGLQATH